MSHLSPPTPTPDPTSASSALNLLDLPVEIRQLIATHVFASNTSISYHIHEDKRGRLAFDRVRTTTYPPSARDLLFVNKQMYHEAIDIYWQTTVLRLSGAYWRSREVAKFLSPACSKNVKRLSLETLSHKYDGIVSCFPSLKELRLPERETVWMSAATTISEVEAEDDLRRAIVWGGIWDTVKKHDGLEIKCRISFVLMHGRREKSRRTWDVEFGRRTGKMLQEVTTK